MSSAPLSPVQKDIRAQLAGISSSRGESILEEDGVLAAAEEPQVQELTNEVSVSQNIGTKNSLWQEIQPGVLVNLQTKQIYFSQDFRTNVKLSELFNSKDLSKFQVVVDDTNTSGAKLTVDVPINELVVDSSMFGSQVNIDKGKVNVIWNDVTAVKANINTNQTTETKNNSLKNEQFITLKSILGEII